LSVCYCELALFCAEEIVPHRRRPQKGSFGSHFDELVNHFPADREKRDAAEADSLRKPQDAQSAQDRLFDRAWSKPD
jgi:hypothetical protein